MFAFVTVSDATPAITLLRGNTAACLGRMWFGHDPASYEGDIAIRIKNPVKGEGLVDGHLGGGTFSREFKNSVLDTQSGP